MGAEEVESHEGWPIAYRRSVNGETVHRVGCKRLGKKTHPWVWASKTCGNNHAAVMAEIRAVSWLRACSTCMKESVNV